MAVTAMATLKATVDQSTVVQGTVSAGQVVGIKVGSMHLFGRVRTNGRNNVLGTTCAVVEVIVNDDGIDLTDPATWTFVVTAENRKSTDKNGVVTKKVVADRVRFNFPTFRLIVLASPVAPPKAVKASDDIAKYLK